MLTNDSNPFSALIITIAISAVLYGKPVSDQNGTYIHWYWMQGAYGSIPGIIAGPLGIAAANSKRLSRTKCLWTSHIILVSSN